MTDPGFLLTITFVLYFLGIAAVLWLPEKMTAPALAGFGGLGSLLLLVTGGDALFSSSTFHSTLWAIPGIGDLTISIDYLSAFFLVVTALVALPAVIFAAARIADEQWCHPGYRAALYLGLLIAIPLVVISADVFLFLVAWEVMSILIYLLVNSGHSERPGYLMLAIGEAGTLAVLVAFLLLAGTSGTLSFAELKVSGLSLGPGLRWVIFILSFAGFGVKGGLIPMNFWIPRAYTAAPNAFIPLIAGATLNMGLYGIIRVNTDLLPITQAGPGITMLIIGSVTALIGILYATIEDDFKTLLAHSSIENAGIITAALGASVLFLATGHRVAAAMALLAALYHLLNHSIFKTLLFMGAGVVEEAAGTRSLDRMGGLLKRMPWTGFFMLVGVLSIAAMPPFNGFVSEWLTLESLLRSTELTSLGIKIAFVVAGVALALTAGLAVTCFVRAFAMGFLGMPRSEAARSTHETRSSALRPMALLALACLAFGVLPTYVIPAVDRVVAPLTGASATRALVPPFFEDSAPVSELPQKFASEFHDLGAQLGHSTMPGRGLAVIHRGGEKNPVVFAMSTSYMFVTLILLLGVCAGVVWLVVVRRRKTVRRPRWDGGVRHLMPEMTYTATGFAQPVRVVFEAILRPQIVDRRETIAKYFRVAIQQERKEIHLVDRLVLHPLAVTAQWIASSLARMHHGQINAYAGYALLVLVLFLVIASTT
ncbi:MAG TPA: hypothetical protein ENI62_09665 [Gammaproteobacteria bacterium]|nr:hypothetical protein [Gammaproteobacteria bacterium]